MTKRRISYTEPIRKVTYVLNKLHLFRRKQFRFILNRVAPLHACYMLLVLLRPSTGITILKYYKDVIR
jgi:hypothetical protein